MVKKYLKRGLKGRVEPTDRLLLLRSQEGKKMERGIELLRRGRNAYENAHNDSAQPTARSGYVGLSRTFRSNIVKRFGCPTTAWDPLMTNDLESTCEEEPPNGVARRQLLIEHTEGSLNAQRRVTNKVRTDRQQKEEEIRCVDTIIAQKKARQKAVSIAGQSAARRRLKSVSPRSNAKPKRAATSVPWSLHGSNMPYLKLQKVDNSAM